jgi:hypothetical protein
VEIDLVAISEDEERIRFGSCKRNGNRLPGSIDALKQSAERFLTIHKRFRNWRIEYVGVAPEIGEELGSALVEQGVIPESLSTLTRGL